MTGVQTCALPIYHYQSDHHVCHSDPSSVTTTFPFIFHVHPAPHSPLTVFRNCSDYFIILLFALSVTSLVALFLAFFRYSLSILTHSLLYLPFLITIFSLFLCSGCSPLGVHWSSSRIRSAIECCHDALGK